jgi:thioredoxin-related protein
MKIKYIILFLFTLSINFSSFAKSKKAKIKITWMSLAEAEEKIKTNPKRILVDIYTSWCYWCKVMDKKTYRNHEVIEYLSEHFYCVKLNAEQNEPIQFKGDSYLKMAGSKTSSLVYDWLFGQVSYPTTVFFNDQFEKPKPQPGFLDAETMLTLLHYIVEEKEGVMPFEMYNANYKGNITK